MFKCETCDYCTTTKCNYTKHLLTTKHLKANQLAEICPKLEKVSPKLAKISRKVEKELRCKYCDKVFKHSSSVSKHIKYSCTKNKDEDLKELIRLMNLQLQQKDEQINKQGKHIDRLMEKLQVNQFQTNSQIIQNNHIQLLSYKDTDTSHLTDRDFKKAITKVNECVSHLIERIHYNPSKPENMNIKISNMKDRYLMVYEDGNWKLKNKNSELDSLYETNEVLLEEWLDEEQHKYPELKYKFNRYLNNKEDNETFNEIKDGIKVMMYNKRNMINQLSEK